MAYKSHVLPAPSTDRIQRLRQRDTSLQTFAKTFLWLLHPQYFLERVVMEILQFSLEATMSNKHGAVRLNGTSDIKWYLYIDFAKLANDTGLRFYDYTKNPIDYRIPHPSAFPTVHGDDDDLRMLDNQGSLVVLYAKNKALRDDTAFVTRISL